MTTQHTPGPWRIGHQDHTQTKIFGAHRTEASHIASTPFGTIEDASNARLIAAAPELLAALEAVIAESRRVIHPDSADNRLYSIDVIARAAIAKATGSP